jgi:hypothetical protein
MFVEVSRPTYHSPITIESLTYRLLLGPVVYSASVLALGDPEVEALPPRIVLQNRPSLRRRGAPVFSPFALFTRSGVGAN